MIYFMVNCVKAVTAGGIEDTQRTAGYVILGVFNGVFTQIQLLVKPTFSNNYPASIVASDIVAFVIRRSKNRLRKSSMMVQAQRHEFCWF